MHSLFTFPFPASRDQRQHYDRFKPTFTYRFMWELGKGNNVVSLVQREDTGGYLAMKSCQPPVADLAWTGFGNGNVRMEEMLQARKRDVMSKVDKMVEDFETLHELQHPNIVKHLAMDILFDTNRIPQINLFMECCSGGTLSQRAAMSNGLSIPEMKRYTEHIASGLAYLHSLQIIHLDLKGRNIVISDQDVAKICDFGEMVKLECPQTQPEEVQMNVGTSRYKAPEMTQQDFPRGRAADIFSFGCVLIEMRLGRPPSYTESKKASTEPLSCPETNDVCISYHSVIGKGPIMPNSVEVPQHWYLLYRQCLQVEPSFRPTAAEILRHPALKWDDEMRLEGEAAQLFGLSNNQVDCLDEDMDEGNVTLTGHSATVNVGVQYVIESQSYPAPRQKMAAFVDRLNLLQNISRPGHANIQQFFGAHLIEKDALHFVVEALPNGSLADLFRHFSLSCNVMRHHQRSFRFENAYLETRLALSHVAKGLRGELKLTGYNECMLTTKTLLGIACQVASAMQHLSNRGTLHLNLSKDTVFFDQNFVPKINISTRAVECSDNVPAFLQKELVVPVSVGAPPEMHGGRVSKASDVWALGVLLLEIFQLGETAGVGWQSSVTSSQHALNSMADAEHVSSSPSTFSWSDSIEQRFFPPQILDVLEGCFRSKPSQRCTFSDITSSLRCIKSVQQYAFYLPPALLRAASAPECASRKRPRSALADIRNELPGSSQDLGNCDGPLGLFSRSFNGEMDF